MLPSILARSIARVVAVALACLAPAVASAEDASAQVQQRFESRFEGVPVDGVTRTPYGLYELQVGGTLLYTDEAVSFVLEGTLIDAATRTNVTSQRQEVLSAVPFDELPLELAFEQRRGDGSRKLAVFEDPNCGYCKQLRHTLRDLDDVTIYTFMYPILAPDSAVKVRSVWCAENRAEVWDAWMLENQAPPVLECDAPMSEFVALGRKLNVRGTPTIFFEDGSRASGALPRAMLEDRLLTASAP